MKSDIHPQYHPKAKISCACGNSMTLGATQESIKVEICSKCHPFYTGSHDLIDTTGRVERFKARKAKAGPASAKKVKTVKTRKEK